MTPRYRNLWRRISGRLETLRRFRRQPWRWLGTAWHSQYDIQPSGAHREFVRQPSRSVHTEPGRRHPVLHIVSRFDRRHFRRGYRHTPINGLALIAESSSDAYAFEALRGSFRPKSQINYGFSYQASDGITLAQLPREPAGGNVTFELDPTHDFLSSEARRAAPRGDRTDA